MQGEASQMTIDQTGHILIPKAICARLGLVAGTKLVVEERSDARLLLRPLLEEAPLVDKGGVLVVQARAIGELAGAEKRDREARLAELVQSTGQ